MFHVSFTRVSDDRFNLMSLIDYEAVVLSTGTFETFIAAQTMTSF